MERRMVRCGVVAAVAPRGDLSPLTMRPPLPPPGICKVSWENATLQVVVTVFGLSVEISPQAGSGA